MVFFSRTGLLPQDLSALRATRCPIHAFSDNPLLFRHLLLVSGVELFFMDFSR